MVAAQVVVVAAHVAADTTPVAENAATRARTNKVIVIFFMIDILYFTQVGLSPVTYALFLSF